MNAQEKKILLVCGCPRSGTTALWTMLISNPNIVLGVERYGAYLQKNETLKKELFTYDRFFDLRGGDTFYQNMEEFTPYYKDAKVRFERASYVGDKIPRAYEYIDNIMLDIPSVRIVMISRDIYEVAGSYKKRQINNEGQTWPAHFGVEKAVEDWNESLLVAKNSLQNNNFLHVNYEEAFYSDSDVFEKLFTWFGLEYHPLSDERLMWMRKRAKELINERRDVLSLQDREYIQKHSNQQVFHELCL